jgi:nickel-dependent lactate racemase
MPEKPTVPGSCEIEVPPGWNVDLLFPSPSLTPLGDDKLPPPSSLPVPKGKTVVVVNDAQRPTPTPWLLERLDLDWKAGDIVVAVATGCHRPPDEGELLTIFGPFLERVRPRLLVHRAGEEMLHLGRTARGTPVEVNRCLEGAAAVVCLGSVEPHYFAGWTGGRKSLIPGLSSLETIRANHSLALEGTGPGELSGNSLHLDLMEAVGIAGRALGEKEDCTLLALNVVCRKGRYYGWNYSPLADVLEGLVPAAQTVYGRVVERPSPFVLCLVDPPLDRDLYQALKAFEHWKTAVAGGGTLILSAGCPEGMGPPTFRQFGRPFPSLEELEAQLAGGYLLSDHKLISFLRYRESGRHVVLLDGGGLDGEDLPLPSAGTLPQALEAAAALSPGLPSNLLVVGDGGHLFPVLDSQGGPKAHPAFT